MEQGRPAWGLVIRWRAARGSLLTIKEAGLFTRPPLCYEWYEMQLLCNILAEAHDNRRNL